MNIPVEMKRGGKVILSVFGNVHNESDGSGLKWTEIEIEEILWPNGGKCDLKNIADIEQVKEEFYLAILQEVENARN